MTYASAVDSTASANSALSAAGEGFGSVHGWSMSAANGVSTTRRVIIERAAELRLPAVYQWPETAEEGGLLGYGPRFVDVFRQRARMVAKILSGAKPADLPVEQPTTFELVINLKTAKAIGHEVPAGLVLRADKVME